MASKSNINQLKKLIEKDLHIMDFRMNLIVKKKNGKKRKLFLDHLIMVMIRIEH